MDFFFLQDAQMPEILRTPVTLAIMIITGLTSYQAFINPEIKYKLIFNANIIKEKKEWYRFWSHGLIHANWLHLGLNMFVLYEFGRVIEMAFNYHFGLLGTAYYLLLYGLGLAAASLYSYYQHQDNYGYNALGASGAVSGIVFAFILLMPTQTLLLFMVIPMPAIVLGIAYLAYSHYMSRKGNDNIGHDAHFWGAVWGVAFTAALDLILNQGIILRGFVYQITNWGA